MKLHAKCKFVAMQGFFFSKFSKRFFTGEDKVPQAHFSEQGAVPKEPS